MKRKLMLGLLMSLVMAGMVSAQTKEEARTENRKENFSKMKAQRVAFITERANFTPDEAAAFWPVCNELQQKKFELNEPVREARRAIRRSTEAVKDAEYLRFMELNAEAKMKEAQLEKEYFDKFKKILSPQKLFKYQRAEEEFMRQMFSSRAKMGDKKTENWQSQPRENRPRDNRPGDNR